MTGDLKEKPSEVTLIREWKYEDEIDTDLIIKNFTKLKNIDFNHLRNLLLKSKKMVTLLLIIKRDFFPNE